MSLLRPLMRSFNIGNGLLLIAVVLAAYGMVTTLDGPFPGFSLPAVKKWVPQAENRGGLPQDATPGDYAIISDRNLFHPERRIPPEKKEEKSVARPEVTLHGTLVTAGLRIAFVEDKKNPYVTAGRGSRQIVLKIGETLGGYTLQEVEADRIVLARGEERILVLLNDVGKRKTDPVAQQTAAKTASAASPAKLPTLSGGSLPQAPSVKPTTIPPGTEMGATSAPPAAGAPGNAGPRTPGIGASGVWPPTQNSVEETRQRLNEGQQMRMLQFQH